MVAVDSVRFFNGVDFVTYRLFRVSDDRYFIIEQYDDGEQYRVPYQGQIYMDRAAAYQMLADIREV